MGMECGHKGRALAAGRNVAAAEIGNDAHPRKFGKEGGIANLQGIAAVRPVAECLAMAADGPDAVTGVAGCQGLDCAGVESRQFVGCACGQMDLVGLGNMQGEQLRAQCVVVRQIVRPDEAGRRFVLEFDQNGVDTIQTGA